LSELPESPFEGGPAIYRESGDQVQVLRACCPIIFHTEGHSAAEPQPDRGSLTRGPGPHRYAKRYGRGAKGKFHSKAAKTDFLSHIFAALVGLVVKTIVLLCREKSSQPRSTQTNAEWGSSDI
jgi:hypothetical protein